MLIITRRCPSKRSMVTFALFTAIVIYLIWLKSYRSPKTKYVLSWSPFCTDWNDRLGHGFAPFKNCEHKNCFATTNRSLIDLDQYAALIFHASTYNKEKHGVPWRRSPDQIYIFMNLESPLADPGLYLKHYGSYFNWTMTYRLDSNIVFRHGYVSEEKTNYRLPSKEFLENKTGVAAWFVSNCHTKSHREALGVELQKFMSLDLYGACGQLQCGPQGNASEVSPPECLQMIEKNYKFYLVFENVYCWYYSTTENLYNVLARDLVPVVYGADDYFATTPPHSVINAEDFASAEDLTHYLTFLDRNQEQYLRYFEWKKAYRVGTSMEAPACQICKKLHEPPEESVYDDLYEWWTGHRGSVCKEGMALPKIVSDLLPYN